MKKSTTQRKKAALRKVINVLWKQAVAERWGMKCEACGKPSGPPHHFFNKAGFGHLRFDVDNGIPLCPGCHMKHHNGNPTIQQAIIRHRGQEWYDSLEQRALHDRPEGTYMTLGWYENHKQALLKTLENGLV